MQERNALRWRNIMERSWGVAALGHDNVHVATVSNAANASIGWENGFFSYRFLWCSTTENSRRNVHILEKYKLKTTTLYMFDSHSIHESFCWLLNYFWKNFCLMKCSNESHFAMHIWNCMKFNLNVEQLFDQIRFKWIAQLDGRQQERLCVTFSKSWKSIQGLNRFWKRWVCSDVLNVSFWFQDEMLPSSHLVQSSSQKSVFAHKSKLLEF